MFKIEHWITVLFTAAMMIGSYFLIEDLTEFSTPLAIIILFIDEVILLFLGVIGWRVDQVVDRFKK